MKRLSLLTLFFVLLINNNSFSQARIENKMSFYDAESWVLFEDYKEALQIYLRLIRFYPNNSNYKYRIGQCYINIPGEKDKAISYLEDAVKNINPNYKEGKFKETGAPYDALYYLANAYSIDNQLDKAIEIYNLFKKNMDPDVYDSTIVNLQIESCRNARNLMGAPLYIKENNLGNNINETSSEFNPVISNDEKLMVFTKSLAFYDAILFSTNTDGSWSTPVNLNELLKVDYNYYPTSISNDGTKLFLYNSENYDGVIFVSTFENGLWSTPVRLNDNINTKYWESHATISNDSKKLYFTSNRKGTFGGLDIYVSSLDSTGNWGPAENLGPVINTPYNEETPFLSKDDRTLFFSSRGHYNMGGYDIFYSTRLDNGEWTVPLNAGFPMNSTDDDVFYRPVNEGYEGYYAKFSPYGFGKQDIYRVEIFSEDHPRKFIIRGMVKVADLIGTYRDSVKISAMNIRNPEQMVIVYSDPRTGEYEFELPQGNYEVTYDSPYAEKIKKNLDLPINNPSDSFLLPGTILPKTDFVADLVVKSNKNISASGANPILLPLKVEPGSILTVEHWVGDSLLYSETFPVKDTSFVYKLVPQRGDNKVTFKITDKFNNTTTADVFVKRGKEITSVPIVRPEYSRVIANKQIAALTEMLKKRADDKLRKVISDADINNQKFAKVDDLISYIKDEASKSNISPEEVDKLALKVAVMDNVLTQAVVDLLANYTDGDLKKILQDVDIYDQNLKTWTDLQEYIAAKTGGLTSPEDLNMIAADILTNADPNIILIQSKIQAYGEKDESGSLIHQSIEATQGKKIKKAGLWLNSFYDEAHISGLTDKKMSDMFAIISAKTGADISQFTDDLASHAEEPFLSWLRSVNLKKENIRNPSDHLFYIFNNKGNIPPVNIFNTLADMIAANDISVDEIRSRMEAEKGGKLWYLWILIGAGILFIILFYRRKQKKENK
jgi:tetratricopeptide (TPR) repeat protein